MSVAYENLCAEIEKQQKGHENEVRFAIGEQLKDMARGRDNIASLLLHDLQTSVMTLADIEKHFADYANKNHGSSMTFCITPQKAEELIREFYKLPDSEPKGPESHSDNILNLEDFL